MITAITTDVPAENLEGYPGGYSEPNSYMTAVYILWPLYISTFLAVFMKEKILQLLSIFLLGILPALGFPMFTMAAATEPIPEETGLIFFIAALFEILMMLISILYLLHFWIYRLTGKEAKPSVKIVLIELVFLMALLILIGKSK